MRERELGSAGLVSSAIGLGTLAFADAYGPVSRSTCGRVIRLALDMGVTMIDVAGYPQRSKIETLLGASLSTRRQQALLATSEGGPPGSAAGPRSGDPASLARACDESLRRLRTDYIDVFYLSGPDPHVPVEDRVGQLGALVAAGKVRYLGLRYPLAEQLRRAHATHPVSVLCVEYSLRERSAERQLLPLAAELGIGIVACSPLARGLLARGSYAEIPAGERAALRAIETEAAELDLGRARLSLAWLLSTRRDIVPVPGTRNPVHMEMNASSADIGLSPQTCARLAEMFPPDSEPS